MSPATGWIGEPEPGAAPPGFSDFILANRGAAGQGSSLGQVLGRAAAVPEPRDDEPEDFDGKAAAMLTRGYSPGLLSQLSMRLGDTMAELEGEQELLDRSARRAEQVHRAHQNGQVRAWDIPGLLGDDQGDESKVRMLERRAESLRTQIGEAQGAISPSLQREPADPLERATSRAHAAFVEATRSAWAAVEAGRPVVRPKAASVSRGDAVPAEVTCQGCADVGASPVESYLIHNDPAPAPVPEGWEPAERHVVSR